MNYFGVCVCFDQSGVDVEMGLDTISVCAADFLFSVSVRVHIFYSDRRSGKIRLLSLSNWENVASMEGMVGALRSFTSCLQLA